MVYKRPPSNFNGGHFFEVFCSEVIEGSSGTTWVRNLKKCWFSTGAQTVWNFDLCCFSDFHYFQIWRGVSLILLSDPRSFRGTFGVKCWKWGVSCKINIGLQIISHLQKKLFLQRHINSKGLIFARIVIFLPQIKNIACFQKKNFNVKVKI